MPAHVFHVPGDDTNQEFPEAVAHGTMTDGDDTLTATGEDDVVSTGEGEDVVDAGGANDFIGGLIWRDFEGTVRGRSEGAEVRDTDSNEGDAFAVVGGDQLNGGGGNDEIYVGYDSVANGGGGSDRAYVDLLGAYYHWVAHSILYSFNEQGIDVDLAAADSGSVILTVGGIGDLTVTLTDIEAFDIALGHGNDRLWGAALADRLDGDRGDDELHGRGGNDRLFGGRGADLLYGDEGADVLEAGAVTTYWFEDFAVDLLSGGADGDLLAGGRGDRFDGGSGSDHALIELGSSTYSYALNLDLLTSAATVDFGDGGEDAGYVHSGTSTVNLEHIDALILGSGNDSVTGHVDRFGGNSSRFSFIYDGLYCGAGNDSVHLIGTLREDFLSYVSGGQGTDTITLDGDYATLFRLGYNSVNGFETVILAAGHDYVLGTSIGFDAMLIDGSALGAADNLSFTGDPAALQILGGAGADSVRITSGPFNSQQRVDLGGGDDALLLDGNFSAGITFAPTTMANVETLRLMHSVFGQNSYRITTVDANVASGQALRIDATQLGPGFHAVETLIFDGSSETNGRFVIDGGAGGDTLTGGAGNDQINGRAGNDVMTGRQGNDTYYVDSAGDRPTESAGQGSDIVYTSVSYTLAANTDVESLSTISWQATDALNLTGNGLANTLIGNAGVNQLNGGGGNDVMFGREGNDSYIVDSALDRPTEYAGQGTDIVYTSISYTLASNSDVENLATISFTATNALNLTGNGLANNLIGNDGANQLDGKSGADVMVGRAGNDKYLVDNAGDKVFETPGGGQDVVFTAISVALTNDQEIEGLSSIDWNATYALNLTGNSLRNNLIGNAGVNVLDGKAGNDTLQGREGVDTYAFTTALGATNVDLILGFSSADDTIRLENNGVFTGLAAGALPASAFVIGTAAQDLNDRIVYNQATGQLFFDADGSGAGAQIQFARLDGAPIISASDFTVI